MSDTSVNAMLRTALSSTGFQVLPDTHRPEDEPIYYTFNVDTYPMLYGDNAPQYERWSVMLHLWAPNEVNTLALRDTTKALLVAAGFEYPSCIDAGDEDGQHWVFETEGIISLT